MRLANQRLARRWLHAMSAPMTTAISLLWDAPNRSLDELITMVSRAHELRDPESGDEVSKDDVIALLEGMKPPPLYVSNGITVYHATDPKAAKILLKRGFIPEGKPRNLGDDYSPGHGLDLGLYVGVSPNSVESYGRVTLAVTVPKDFLRVPTELAQLGEDNPLAALRSHDGAVILDRIHPKAFSVHEGHRYLMARVYR